MIDAATFSHSYHAFWNSNTPMCEHFVRRLNLAGLNRFARPMISSDVSKRRAIVAEFAFSLFVAEKRNELELEVQVEEQNSVEQVAWRETVVRLTPYVGHGIDLDLELNEEERREVSVIRQRLVRFFNETEEPLILRPMFAGCGYVDKSEGDVISGETIYEVKTVERPFRSTDIRQTITYAALNFLSKQFQISSMGLCNPRSGQYCSVDLEYVCAEISGKTSQELFGNIVDAISSGEISR